MSTHTPGPWTARAHDDIDTGDIRGPHGEEIALCCKAEANLIAAAPDLLVALLACGPHIANMLDGQMHWSEDDMERVDDAVKLFNAAIAKADGK